MVCRIAWTMGITHYFRWTATAGHHSLQHHRTTHLSLHNTGATTLPKNWTCGIKSVFCTVARVVTTSPVAQQGSPTLCR